MKRDFTGLSGTGGGIKKSSTFKKLYRKGEAGADINYKKMMDDRIEEKREQHRSAGGAFSFSLPGTAEKEEKGLSKSTQIALEKWRAKKQREVDKKKRQQTDITARRIGFKGGRIDKQGRIFGLNGQVVMTVDPKNGKIRNGLGMVVGKYKPGSNACMFRLERLIERYSQQQGNLLGIGRTPTAGQKDAFGNVIGESPFGGASSYGTISAPDNSGGGNNWFWGGSDDDKGGWW